MMLWTGLHCGDTLHDTVAPYYFLLLYPRHLPGPLCCPVSRQSPAGVKVRCQAWERAEGGGGIALHPANEAEEISKYHSHKIKEALVGVSV